MEYYDDADFGHAELTERVHESPAWVQARLAVLDNLLALYSLQRKEFIYGRGFLVFHPRSPNVVRWLDATSSEESWLEDVKLLAQ